MWNCHACAVVVGSAMMCSIVIAQSTNPFQGASALDPRSEALQHLASTYAAITPFDLNGDGEFDAAERADLLASIEDGTWPLVPLRMRAGRMTPPHEILLSRIAEVYAMTRPCDANRDETLDAQEQHALEALLPCGDEPRWRRPNAGCAGAPRWHGQVGGDDGVGASVGTARDLASLSQSGDMSDAGA